VVRQNVSISYYRTLLLTAHSLVVALLLSVLGCATPEPPPERAPAPHVSASTWQQVDDDIAAASRVAWESAENFARGLMDGWMRRVRELGEEDFIPWYTGYWTQQWLSIKVAWYKMGDGGSDGDGDGNDASVRRLAAYLQEEYAERVLEPASEEIDPDVVTEQATNLYVKLLAEQLQGMPRRHGVPRAQFERRLKALSAIAAATPAAPDASLYDLVHSQPVGRLPAYASLLARLHEGRSRVVAGPVAARISPIAERAARKLIDQMAISGGASAAAAAVGGVAGMVLSLGAAGVGAIAHAQEKPALEAQLRATLDSAQTAMWRQLVDDPDTGVLAGIKHIADQIELGLGAATAEPQAFEPAVLAPEFPDEEPFNRHHHHDPTRRLPADFPGGG
jgi:hypothetical protein